MMRTLSRWLPWRRSTAQPLEPTTTEPTSPNLTADTMPPLTHHRAEYLGIRRMHLLRADECFEYALSAWVTIIRFAAVTGQWQPAGTSAAASLSPPAFGGYGVLWAGHYMPIGQQLHAEDAAALAVGIRRALAEMPIDPEFQDGGGRRLHQVNDPRLHENANDAGIRVLVWQLVLDQGIDKGDGELLASFLERGACSLQFGEPAHVRAAEEADKRRRARRLPFELEQSRLLSAVQSGTVAPELAGPRITAISVQLAAFDAEEAARVSV